MSATEDAATIHRLTGAAATAIGRYENNLTRHTSRQAAKDVTAAVLRALSEEMVEGGWEDGDGWPDPDDLTMLADDIEGGGE